MHTLLENNTYSNENLSRSGVWISVGIGDPQDESKNYKSSKEKDDYGSCSCQTQNTSKIRYKIKRQVVNFELSNQ
jgi:hypothetical protein